MPDAPYLPIAHHGLIGDLRTCALVARTTTIDWFCAPRFDSPSIFAPLLDPEQRRLLGPGAGRRERRAHQFYLPDSNILVTRLMTDQGMVEVHDFMPLVKRRRPAPAAARTSGPACAATSRPDADGGPPRLRPRTASTREVEGGVLVESGPCGSG